jgi:hypothetical protein
MKIDNPRVRYHRNGCSGEGFHTVSFTEGRGSNRQWLRAVVFEERGCCAVMDVNDANRRFRGDHYEEALRYIIAAAANDPLTYDYDAPVLDGGLRAIEESAR